MKKVAIIGTVGLPANYGGFETLTHHLVKNLSNQYDFTVYCTSKKYPKAQRLKHYLGARLKFLPFHANGIQSIIYDSISILHALLYADVLLVLGVAGAWLLPFVRFFTRKKIIISIDGIEWKRDKWNPLAKMYLWWVESLAVKYSHIDISDNESIQDYTALRYNSLSRVIEYGGDHVEQVESTNDDHEKYWFLRFIYAIKVCRIEPENNVHLILKAFVEANKYPMVIIGNWDNSDYGRMLKKEYGNYENIILLDPIYDQRTLDLLRVNATLYVHGHSAGGTNPSLVEAMSLGLPVLSYNVSYNRTTTENKASYFKNEKDIVAFIKNWSVENLRQNATAMKEVAARRYKWSLIAQKYGALLQEVLVSKTNKSVSSNLEHLTAKELLDYGVAHFNYQYSFYEKHNNK